MKISFQFTLSDLLAFQRYHLKHSETTDYTLLLFRVIFPVVKILFIVGAALFLHHKAGHARHGKPWLTLGFIAFAVVWFFASPKLMELLKLWQIKHFYRHGEHPLFTETAVILQEDQIISDNSITETKTRWKGIEKIGETQDHFFFYGSVGPAVIVPRRAFASMADYESFVRLSKEYYGRA